MDGELKEIDSLHRTIANCEAEKSAVYDKLYEAQADNAALRQRLAAVEATNRQLVEALKAALPLARAYQLYSYNTEEHQAIIQQAQRALAQAEDQ